MAEAAQWAGRVVWDQDLHGLYLMMVEPWALELSLVGADGQMLSDLDPDRPYAGMVKKTSSKSDCTSYAPLQFAQSKICLHKLFVEYLNDQSPEGYSYWLHNGNNSLIAYL